MAKRSPKKKKSRQPKHRRRIATEKVASPWNNGFDRIERVIDTLSAMRKRKQIDDRQLDAAIKYRTAYETCHGSVKSALDTSNTGGSMGPRSTSPAQTIAAGVLADAAKMLGKLDGYIVELVAGQGRSIEEAGSIVYGGTADAGRAAGKRLKDSLIVLALRWFGPDKSGKTRIFMPEDARPTSINTGEIAPANSAHAAYDGRGKFEVKKSG